MLPFPYVHILSRHHAPLLASFLLASRLIFIILIFKVSDNADLSALAATGPTAAAFSLLLIFNLLGVVGNREEAVLMRRLPDVLGLVSVILIHL